MRDHAFAFGIEDLHLQGPQADDHLMAGVFGSGRVPVAALDGDVSVFVGLHPRPRDHVERLGGQGQQRLSVLVEQAGLALALPVMVLVPQFEAAAGQAQVEAVEAPHAGHRHEQPSAHGPDPGLDRALLVARVRVAERVLEPVMGLERLEQAGQADLVEPSAAHAGGIVVHDAPGHPAQPFEQVPEGLARAFRVLPGHQLARPDVRVREIQHEMPHPRHDAPVAHVDLAEVRLAFARMPRQVQETHLALRHELTLQPGHRPGHRRQRRLHPVLVTQPLVDARRRVTLLVPGLPVLGEHALDHGNPLVEHRATASPYRRPGRQVVGLEILAHGRLADLLAARDRGDGLPIPAPLTDRLYLGHADHLPFRPFPEWIRSTIRLRPTGGRHAFLPKPEKTT